jgi:membrane associated rhomboid family serine protease
MREINPQNTCSNVLIHILEKRIFFTSDIHEIRLSVFYTLNGESDPRLSRAFNLFSVWSPNSMTKYNTNLDEHSQVLSLIIQNSTHIILHACLIHAATNVFPLLTFKDKVM